MCILLNGILFFSCFVYGLIQQTDDGRFHENAYGPAYGTRTHVPTTSTKYASHATPSQTTASGRLELLKQSIKNRQPESIMTRFDNMDFYWSGQWLFMLC